MNVEREQLEDLAACLLSCVDVILEALRDDDHDILHFAQPFIPFAEPVRA